MPPFARFLKSFDARPGDEVTEGRSRRSRPQMLLSLEERSNGEQHSARSDNATARGELAERVSMRLSWKRCKPRLI